MTLRKTLLNGLVVALLVGPMVFAAGPKGDAKSGKAPPKAPPPPIATDLAPDQLYKTQKDAAEDVFTIKDTIVQPKPAGFGLNIHGGTYNYAHPPLFNCYTTPAWMFEPMSVTADVYLETAALCKDGTIRRPPTVKDKDPKKPDKPDEYGLSGNGGQLCGRIANGMSCYLLTRKNDCYERVYDGKVQDSFMRNGPTDEENIGKEWLTLTKPCPTISDNDILQVDLHTTEYFDPNATRKLKLLKADLAAGKKPQKNLITDYERISMFDDEGKRLFAIDPAQKAPEGGSTASGRIDIPNDKQLHAVQSTLGVFAPPGTPMIVEVWLKQEGMPTGEVSLQVGPHLKTKVKATAEWQKTKIEFKAIDAPRGSKDAFVVVGSSEPGKLWIDSLFVYRKDLPPFAPQPEIVDEIKDMKTATIRFWNCGAWSAGNVPLRSWISSPLQQPINAGSVTLGQALEMCRQAGADPWLMLDKTLSDEAAQAIVEYIAAPADAGYGKVRAEQGRKEPWTTAFKNVYFECDNESWGWGKNIDQYVCMLNRFNKILRKSPYYKDGYFKTIGNSWALSPVGKDWGEPLTHRTESDLYDAGPYIQGADGVTIMGENDTKQLRMAMLNPRMVSIPTFENALVYQKDFRAQNPGRRPWGFAVYESGPGYPNARDPNVAKQAAILGHSLALGIAMLDQYMAMTQMGFERICFYQFTFSAGDKGGVGQWSTHDGSIRNRSVAWNAMKLRNTCCAGDLITVESNVKTITIPRQKTTRQDYKGEPREYILPEQKDLQLTYGYAFKDGGNYSFLAYNLSVDEPRKVKINLPTSPKARAKLVTLTHPDPRANNITPETVGLKTSDINDFASGYTLTIPPHSAVAIQWEAK